MDDRPNDPGIAWRLGECYRMGNNIDVGKQYVAESKEHLDRALEIDADCLPAHVSLGKLVIQAYRKMLFEKQGEVPWELPYMAEEYFLTALERSGTRVDPDIYKGLSYVSHYSNPGSSMANLEKAIDLGGRYLENRPGDAAFRRTFQTYRIKRRLLEECAGGQEDTLVVTPPGKGSTADHSWEGFSACIERYERYIEDALGWARKNHDIDEKRIFLAGFSLGGDLSWALSMRNPERYRGAIMMGTRCGYRASEEALRELTRGDFRAYFLSGEEELPARYQGINEARQLLEANRIATMYREKAGGHIAANVQELKQALDFILQ